MPRPLQGGHIADVHQLAYFIYPPTAQKIRSPSSVDVRSDKSRSLPQTSRIYTVTPPSLPTARMLQLRSRDFIGRFRVCRRHGCSPHRRSRRSSRARARARRSIYSTDRSISVLTDSLIEYHTKQKPRSVAVVDVAVGSPSVRHRHYTSLPNRDRP